METTQTTTRSTNLTPTEVTDTMIRELRHEARIAGDLDMIATCERALKDVQDAKGDQAEDCPSLIAVAKAINNARAQGE